jgi:HPt (histidine-containing phosphotransfer) domain-containing protein
MCVGRGAMIDWKRVAELREEIGTDGFAEVAEMFLEEAETAVAALTGGLPPGEVEGQLHFLKGSALNLGLAELAAICQQGRDERLRQDCARQTRNSLCRSRSRSGIRTGPRPR